MSEQKLTPWFPISTLPVREGVYNISCQKNNQTGDWYAYFDGKHFRGCWRFRVEDVAESWETSGQSVSGKSWRGIAK